MIFREGQQLERSQAPSPAAVFARFHIDLPLLTGLLLLCGAGLFVLYSATGQSVAQTTAQAIRLVIALIAMVMLAQIPPIVFRRWAWAGYALGLALLIVVLIAGVSGKGAQRWIDIGFRFQPSEIMKIAVPMMAAAYLHSRTLPPNFRTLVVLIAIITMPAVLIARQPDLGTAILISAAGCIVILLAGLRMRVIVGMAALVAAALPLLWQNMREYQRQRVLTLIDPQSDPLGAGYNIIQSKIAIGSGGLFGKGWTNGSQGQLEYLPERSTDFIFAVIGEEFGLLGLLTFICLYLFVVGRGLYIASQAGDTFTRLLAGSISLTFFVYVLVNTAMVTGLIPVVGVPLPLVSYGGTSMVTLMGAFGILMSIHTHKRLLPR
ncbi:MAG: rod shape-determining protein RodA [Pseudomonadota bacterium]